MADDKRVEIKNLRKLNINSNIKDSKDIQMMRWKYKSGILIFVNVIFIKSLGR